MKTLLSAYQAEITIEKKSPDPMQLEVVTLLDQLSQSLILQQNLFSRLHRDLSRLLHLPYKGVKGLYIWGGVGRGKTWLMDLFFHYLPFKQKRRLHFHRFMQKVHHLLTTYQGRKNPLSHVADYFAKKACVLCLDELMVSDIADAMLLGELFQQLFKRGITLIVTSNIEPNDLYKNGLQRNKFLPAIVAIYRYLQVYELKGAQDYRMQFLANTALYRFPLDRQADEQLMQSFQHLAPEKGEAKKVLYILGRKVPTLYCADSVVWFSFDVLCLTSRSFQDYIEIARYFHTVIISGVKVMDESKEDAAKRFIALVDEFYERNVVCLMSLEVPLTDLYKGKRFAFEFQRTVSRLTEMQSMEYLQRPHLA